MIDQSKDDGVIVALLERFEKQRLPRARQLKEKVDLGEKLSDLDIAFLEEVFSDANRSMPLADKHPELQNLVANAIRLYREITEKALDNEK